MLRIGEVASAAGVTVDAVRYYERLGLLKPVARTEGGFRTYRGDSVARLAFIRQAQRLGLRLREIQELLGAAMGSGRQHCERVRAVLVTRIESVETQMAELRAFRGLLRAALEDCDGALKRPNVDRCPVVDSLVSRVGSRSRKAR